jgi:hypothetical protein
MSTMNFFLIILKCVYIRHEYITMNLKDTTSQLTTIQYRYGANKKELPGLTICSKCPQQMGGAQEYKNVEQGKRNFRSVPTRPFVIAITT